MHRTHSLLLALLLALLAFGTACSETPPDGGETETLIEDAMAAAALADGEGEDLSDSLATLDLDGAAEEDVIYEDIDDGDYAASCRLGQFRAKVVAEYDLDGDGELDEDERLALRDDFQAPPFRRVAHARVHRVKRLAWIYDMDDSRDLDEDERATLRADLEARCDARQAWLLDRYDADDSGDLDADEWQAARDDLRERRAARRQAFLDEYDTDGDGALDRFERIEARIDRLESILARHAAALDLYDVDDDGELSTEERLPLREALQDRVAGERFETSELEEGDDDCGGFWWGEDAC